MMNKANLNMRCLRLLAITLALPILAGQATADRAELYLDPMDTTNSTGFSETLRPAANTGGARVMGVQILGTEAPTELFAILPEGWGDRQFCVRTGSSDGLYDSENTYTAPLDTSDPVEVPHLAESDFADKLTELAAHGYGIRIFGTACDDVTAETATALALWGTSERQQSFVLFVNSFDADRLAASVNRQASEECDLIEADISVAFDRVCRLQIPDGATAMTVRLTPIKNGRKGRSEEITIELNG